ncbi:MAG: 50S ribosomal protein L30 [Treponema sp.]|nr:50S ribosomal protein L30 [Treponema sp.]
MATKKLKITLKRSVIGQKPAKKATVRSLGLKKINSSVVQEDNPSVRGMVASVLHLVEVEETN